MGESIAIGVEDIIALFHGRMKVGLLEKSIYGKSVTGIVHDWLEYSRSRARKIINANIVQKPPGHRFACALELRQSITTSVAKGALYLDTSKSERWTLSPTFRLSVSKLPKPDQKNAAEAAPYSKTIGTINCLALRNQDHKIVLTAHTTTAA